MGFCSREGLLTILSLGYGLIRRELILGGYSRNYGGDKSKILYFGNKINFNFSHFIVVLILEILILMFGMMIIHQVMMIKLSVSITFSLVRYLHNHK